MRLAISHIESYFPSFEVQRLACLDMKIAISGTHCSGKTTLLEELSRALSTYDVIDEPYYLLLDEGHHFEEVPTLEDFELQLDRSIAAITDGGRDSLFDRCPMDLLAYLLVHRDSRGFDLAAWLPRVRNAVEQLDLIVFVPVETPDRIVVPEAERPKLRQRVHVQLQELLFENPWKIDVRVLEVAGTPEERARRVSVHLEHMIRGAR